MTSVVLPAVVLLLFLFPEYHVVPAALLFGGCASLLSPSFFSLVPAGALLSHLLCAYSSLFDECAWSQMGEELAGS